MRNVVWRDAEGRWNVSALPDSAPDSDASRGVPIGPPSLAALRLPKDIEVRLHNELYHRGILTERDAARRMQDVQSALAAALRLSVHKVVALYANGVDSGGGGDLLQASTAEGPEAD